MLMYTNTMDYTLCLFHDIPRNWAGSKLTEDVDLVAAFFSVAQETFVCALQKEYGHTCRRLPLNVV